MIFPGSFFLGAAPMNISNTPGPLETMPELNSAQSREQITEASALDAPGVLRDHCEQYTRRCIRAHPPLFPVVEINGGKSEFLFELSLAQAHSAIHLGDVHVRDLHVGNTNRSSSPFDDAMATPSPSILRWPTDGFLLLARGFVFSFFIVFSHGCSDSR